MLTEFISRGAVVELGASVSEVFGLPLIISALDGNILYSSDDLALTEEIKTPEFINYLISLSRTKDVPVFKAFGDETAAVINIEFDGNIFGYAIVYLSTVVVANQDEVDRLLKALRKALGDISIYSAWAMNKNFEDAKSDFNRNVLTFLNGSGSIKGLVENCVESVLKLSLVDTVVLALTDENAVMGKKLFILGDRELLPEAENLPNGSLGWWSLQEKKPIIIRKPNNDPRCRKMTLGPEVRTIGCWPLYVRGTVYGVLFTVSKIDQEFEPRQKEYIDGLAVTLSFMLDAADKEEEISRQMRKVNALREISRFLNSSLDLHTVLDLMINLAMNLFYADVCCVYLQDESSGEFKLRAAQGVTPGEASILTRRFNTGAEDTSELGFAEFPIFSQERSIGVLCLGGLVKGELSQDDRELVLTLTHMAGVAVQNSRMFEKTRRTLLETITVLSLAIEARDKTTFGHSETVRELAVALAETLGLPEKETAALESASLLHDIGKLGVSEATLNKTGSLSSQEYEEFKMHPLIGSEILSAVSSFEDIRDLVKYHHERFDGRGYPEGLKGEEIPYGARILALADTFAAIVSTRSYRSSKDPFEALKVIKGNSGQQFDPALLEALETVVRQRYALKIEVFENVAVGQGTVTANELGLTDREVQILSCIAAGMNNREIADSLFLSEKTVKTHVTHILRKLNLPDRTKAAIYAIQKGLAKNKG